MASRSSLAPRLSVSAARQSIVSAGRQSIAPIAASGAPLRDPRPLREKAWQARTIRQLVEFLVQTGCPVPVSAKRLTAPSSKEFGDIFRFLFSLIEPAFPFRLKIEEDLLPALRTIRYPFVEQINKSQLFSIGSPHAWPTFLGILQWLMECISCCNAFESQDEVDLAAAAAAAGGANDPTSIVSPTAPDGDDSRLHEKYFNRLVISGYLNFLDGIDDFEAIDSKISDAYSKKLAARTRELERLQEETHRLEEEHASLTRGEPPLEIARRNNSMLLSDKEKLRAYIDLIEAKQRKLEEAVSTLHQELSLQEEEIARVTKEKAELQKIVDAQEISPADVDRMNAERDQLALSLQAVAAKLDSTNKIVWESEIALQKKMDDLERVVQLYNTKAFKLGLIGPSSRASPNLSRELEVTVQADTRETMVSVDIRGSVRSELMALREKYGVAVHKAQDDLLAAQDMLEQLSWALTQREEELQAIQSQIAAESQRYAEEKERALTEASTSKDEIETYERQNQRLKTDTHSMLVSAQQRLQRAKLEYEELSARYTAQKDEAQERLTLAQADAQAFYDHVTKTFDELTMLANEHLNEAVAAANAAGVVV